MRMTPAMTHNILNFVFIRHYRISIANRVVRREVCARPEELLGPLRIRRAPKRIGRRQAQREQRRAAEIEAARGDIGFRQRRLVAAETDLQPALCVERPRCLHHFADDRRHRAAHLRRADVLRQFLLQGDLCQ